VLAALFMLLILVVGPTVFILSSFKQNAARRPAGPALAIVAHFTRWVIRGHRPNVRALKHLHMLPSGQLLFLGSFDEVLEPIFRGD